MGGQSQQRKSQHAKESPHKKHRGSTDKRPPPRPRDAPESAAPPAPPMSEQCVGSPLHAQTPTEGDARNLVQTTFGEVEPARCICNVNVERMEKRGPGMTCKYITPKTNSCTACLRTGSGGRHGAHHIGCEKSIYYGMRHEQIYQMKQDSKAKSRDGTKPGAKPTKAGAKGLASITSFFGKKSARVGVSQPPRATEPPSGSSSTSGAPPRPPSPAPGLAARAVSAVKNLISSTTSKKKRDASTAIGDGSVGVDGDKTRPIPALMKNLAEIEDDERKDIILLPMVDDQITRFVNSFPSVKPARLEYNYLVYKHDSVGPEAFADAFPAGQFVVKNDLQINTSCNTIPNLAQHAMRGVEVIFVRYELNRPNDPEVYEALSCDCSGRLKFQRWSWNASDGRCRVVFGTGRPAIAIEAKYKCSKCGNACGATNIALRRKLPPRVRNDYPVSLAHATTGVNWHLRSDLETYLEHDAITYEGCQALVKRQIKVLQITYEEHRNCWYDHVRIYRRTHPDDARVFEDFPPFDSWVGRRFPQPETLRKRLSDAYYSVGSAGDTMSRHMHRTLYFQSVGTVEANEEGLDDKCFSSDHTFDVGKSFNIPNVKMFTMATGWLRASPRVEIDFQGGPRSPCRSQV